jgi:Divergent InlB B-repeat domain
MCVFGTSLYHEPLSRVMPRGTPHFALSPAPRAIVIFAIVVAMIGSGLIVAVDGSWPTSSPSSVIPASSPASSVAAPSDGVSPSTPSPTIPALPAAAAPQVAYHGPILTHPPRAWGADHFPPGASLPSSPPASSPVAAPSSGFPEIHGTCVGKWPSGGQSAYTNGCIGHDEPAVNPFSDLPGSGGNVSWNVALPVSAGPHHLQADTYIAIWFGMDLYDPFGYNGQCFLELQLYPDTNATTGAVQENAWAGFVVAWQIELATGFEDTCFAAPLNEPNGNPLQMNGGDHLYVNMTGWVGSPYGENLSVEDTSLQVSSGLNLFNTTGNYPLDPAYSTNNIEDSLPWSPGGDLPVAFSFESGHTIDNPENDTFGGCDSGAPPPTPLNPSTPCGSYNPKDWAQDTAVPWRIYSVTFFNAHEEQTAVQFGFEQDFGATAWIDGLSFGTCTGRDGSAYCSYPWYSYSASEHAFNFGATDYANTSQDFGQYGEYDTSLVTDSSGLNFYPVKNFTYNDPKGDRLTIVVHGPGAVHFLNRNVATTTTFVDLPLGAYSLNAWGQGPNYFEGYSATGGVQLDAFQTAWSSFQLSADGVITANFGPTPLPSVAIQFADSGGLGEVTVVPGLSFPLSALYPPAGPGFGLVSVFSSTPTVARNGETLELSPGIYSLQAEPHPGYNFTGWKSSSPGIYLFTPESNYTWVNVTGVAGTITAEYSPSTYHTVVWLATYPSQGGRIEFNGHVHANGAVFRAPVGTYDVQAIPAPGYTFVTWGPGLMATMTNFSAHSSVLAQAANIYLTAAFSAVPVVTDGSSHGAFSVNGQLVSSSVSLPQVGNGMYVLEADPYPGYSFASWTVSNATSAWITNPSKAVTSFQLNGSVTISAQFRAEPESASLTFSAVGGTIVFDAIDSFSGHGTLDSLAPGIYPVAAISDAGYQFAGWTTSGALTLDTFYWLNMNTHADVENLAGTWTPYRSVDLSGAGTLTAHFTRVHSPVTFIDFPYNSSASIQLYQGLSSKTIYAGHTAGLAPGYYLVTYSGPLTHLRWFATSNITVLFPGSRVTVIDVRGSGSLYVVSELAGSHGAGNLALFDVGAERVSLTPSVVAGSAGSSGPGSYASTKSDLA